MTKAERRARKKLNRKTGEKALALRAARAAAHALRIARSVTETEEVDDFFGSPPEIKPAVHSNPVCNHPLKDGNCARDLDHEGRHSKTRFKKDDE